MEYALTEHFTYDEMVRSTTAEQQGIDNRPKDTEIMQNLLILCKDTLEPIRKLWGKPIHINSGYRCEALNKAVKGSATSQHKNGEAADITTGDRKGNKQLIQKVLKSSIPYDQLIDEYGGKWIHVSLKRTGVNRHKYLQLG